MVIFENLYTVFFILYRLIAIAFKIITGKLPGSDPEREENYFYIAMKSLYYMAFCLVTVFWQKSWSESFLYATLEDFNCRIIWPTLRNCPTTVEQSINK